MTARPDSEAAHEAEDESTGRETPSPPTAAGPPVTDPRASFAPQGDGADLNATAEKVLWVGRTRWQHFAGRIALWVLGNLGLAILLFWMAAKIDSFGVSQAIWIITAAALVSGVIVVGPVLWRIWSRRYRLTTQRLFVERGILGQTIDQTELIRVDDVRVHKSLFDRLFGLGSIAVLSTDASDRETVIDGVLAPESVAEHIRSHMRTMRKKSLFVENL